MTWVIENFHRYLDLLGLDYLFPSSSGFSSQAQGFQSDPLFQVSFPGAAKDSGSGLLKTKNKKMPGIELVQRAKGVTLVQFSIS